MPAIAASPHAPSTARQLLVHADLDAGAGRVTIRLNTCEPCLLHWGLRKAGDARWSRPPEDIWPEGTVAYDAQAVRTPFMARGDSQEVKVSLQNIQGLEALEFVLFFPDTNQWDNNHGRNHRVPLSPSRPESLPLEALRELLPSDGESITERVFDLSDGCHLLAAVVGGEQSFRVTLLTNLPAPAVLHWGVAVRNPQEWCLPEHSVHPKGSVVVDQKAVQTPFVCGTSHQRLDLQFAHEEAPRALVFVLHEPGTGRWRKDGRGNFVIPVKQQSGQQTTHPSQALSVIAEEIIRPETTYGSWTLMHRFNLAHDLLDRVAHDVDGLAMLFVWLRFSAIRQLDWQRNYNTKPRELAHAQDRLTHKLASLHAASPEQRRFIRLMLGSVGRGGGDGQRIRDEILNIMHRHHIKEVSGHFMEEWHQKLHNNTTPDDVVICEAFLEFQYTHGNLERFYQKLQESGVTRDRLASFERPIRTAPDYIPHLRDALIHDFQNFLRILKAVHSSTDLETAIHAAQQRLNDADRGRLWHLFHRRSEGSPMELVGLATESRRFLAGRLRQEYLRELITLDLTLEQFIRTVIERSIHLNLGTDQLLGLCCQVLENLVLQDETHQELALLLKHWGKISGAPRDGADWALHAKSVADRIARVLGGDIDALYQRLQPIAAHLGNAFHAESWTIELFSEEVVRGGSLGFTLSMLLHHIDPLLRKMANLGPWQIVSRARAAGMVEIVPNLKDIQHRVFETPTVLVAEAVHGDEEVPAGVTAVIAPNVTDVVSHVAVRARNAGLLFASCLDARLLEEIRSFKGRAMELEVTSGGDVMFRETCTPCGSAAVSLAHAPATFKRPVLSSDAPWVLSMASFQPGLLGGKSCHLARMRTALPDWIYIPASMAIPFGTCERVLAIRDNLEIAGRFTQLSRSIVEDPPRVLAKMRETLLELHAPDALKQSLEETAKPSGIAVGSWDVAWHCIKRVWASKWSERAWLSRRSRHLPDANLFMAVLIQEVVPADYAFVMHTVNPVTGSKDELYLELVCGLGETLVGNHPGRAMGVVVDKRTLHFNVVSYPGKSMGLFGGGMMFRSDSNGEDLDGFAGAGLYDSIQSPESESRLLDYADEPLLWDKHFQRDLIETIARAGLEVEKAFGTAQDVEGVMSGGRCHIVQSRPQVGEDG